jgi:DNA polymerase (family X)
MPVQNAEIAAMFDQAAELLEIQGENQFRVRADRRAARVIEGLPQSARSLLSAGRDLSELPGIGRDLAGKIADIVKTGHFGLLDTLKKELASVHSYFDLPREGQTERVIRAMQNRHVSIVGHPTGRLIGEREPYDIDMERVIAAACELGCHLEINAEPDRLDLNDIHAQAAKEAGVKLAISTDAHSVNAFRCMRFGIDQARRASLTADDVINTRPLAGLRKLLRN